MKAGKKRTHYRVQDLEDLKLKAGGPLNLVIQVHGASERAATLVINMDGLSSGEIPLGPDQVTLPEGPQTIFVLELSATSLPTETTATLHPG